MQAGIKFFCYPFLLPVFLQHGLLCYQFWYQQRALIGQCYCSYILRLSCGCKQLVNIVLFSIYLVILFISSAVISRSNTTSSSDRVYFDLFTLLYITLQTIYSGLSKSNFKDHYGHAATQQCLGMIAEINEFSVSDEML